MGAQTSKTTKKNHEPPILTYTLCGKERDELYQKHIRYPEDYVKNHPVIIPGELEKINNNLKIEKENWEREILQTCGPNLVSVIETQLYDKIKQCNALPPDFNITFGVISEYLTNNNNNLNREVIKILVKGLEIDSASHWSLTITKNRSAEDIDFYLKLAGGYYPVMYMIKFHYKPADCLRSGVLYLSLNPSYYYNLKTCGRFQGSIQSDVMCELGMLESGFFPTEKECVICFDGVPNIRFRDCGHACICYFCYSKSDLKSCPVCRTIVSKQIIYL